MRESRIEGKICEFAKRHGIVVLKLVSMGGAQRGVPDRLFLKDGKAAFLEVKATGQSLRPLQVKWLDRLREDGFDAEVFDNVAGAVAWLKEVFGV